MKTAILSLLCVLLPSFAIAQSNANLEQVTALALRCYAEAEGQFVDKTPLCVGFRLGTSYGRASAAAIGANGQALIPVPSTLLENPFDYSIVE